MVSTKTSKWTPVGLQVCSHSLTHSGLVEIVIQVAVASKEKGRQSCWFSGTVCLVFHFVISFTLLGIVDLAQNLKAYRFYFLCNFYCCSACCFFTLVIDGLLF